MLYNELVNKFSINECKLLTTKEELKKLNEVTYQSHIKIDFIAKCGQPKKSIFLVHINKKSMIFY